MGSLHAFPRRRLCLSEQQHRQAEQHRSPGLTAGFGAAAHDYYRFRLRFEPVPNAVIGTPFLEGVNATTCNEGWSDELETFHNPNAKNPIDPRLFGGISQFYFYDGDHYEIRTPRLIIGSRTMLARLVGDKEVEKPSCKIWQRASSVGQDCNSNSF